MSVASLTTGSTAAGFGELQIHLNILVGSNQKCLPVRQKQLKYDVSNYKAVKRELLKLVYTCVACMRVQDIMMFTCVRVALRFDTNPIP